MTWLSPLATDILRYRGCCKLQAESVWYVLDVVLFLGSVCHILDVIDFVTLFLESVSHVLDVVLFSSH